MTVRAVGRIYSARMEPLTKTQALILKATLHNLSIHAFATDSGGGWGVWVEPFNGLKTRLVRNQIGACDLLINDLGFDKSTVAEFEERKNDPFNP